MPLSDTQTRNDKNASDQKSGGLPYSIDAVTRYQNAQLTDASSRAPGEHGLPMSIFADVRSQRKADWIRLFVTTKGAPSSSQGGLSGNEN
jgi:hypothetical protein